MSVRLNKYISDKGICSRREADRFIEQGRVTINGRPAKMGEQVHPGDVVVVNGKSLDTVEAPRAVILAFNKPVGITCTTDQEVRGNIVDYINYGERIFPIGRLDKDSQGLIFLTNQGDIVNKILRAGNNHEKEYVVTVNRPVTDEFVQKMSAGVPILGTITKKCRVRKEGPNVFSIILVQGLNRQIRRMCEHFGYEVVKLERIRIMHIWLKGLRTGEWRELNKREVERIHEMIADSTGVYQPDQPDTSSKESTPRPPAPYKGAGKWKPGKKRPPHPPGNKYKERGPFRKK